MTSHTPAGDDLVARLTAWLRRRASPDSGIDYEHREDGKRRVTLFGEDATFVADHLHGRGAARLVEALASQLTHNSSQTPAGDDLVHIACKAYADATGYYVPYHRGLSSESADKMREGMRAVIEALTSQLTQHTEVEVAWTGSGSLAALAQGHEGFIWPTKGDAHPIALVTKSSYDALAAAKDATIAELDFLLHEGGTMEEQLAKAEARAEAAERQRDALRETLELIADGEGNEQEIAQQTLEALKDEGSARP